MRTTVLGLPIAVVDVEDALTGAWRAHLGAVDVVRVQDPPPDRWADLVSAGFTPKPQILVWRAETKASEEEYLAPLSVQDRKNIRKARRRAAADGLTVEVRSVDAGLFDTFLPLYEREVARMRHGWAAAAEHRDRILADADRHFALCVFDGDTLVSASINEESTARDEVRGRFSATVPDQRHASIARVLYLKIVEVARERGYRWASLGSDPNLYGHLVQPGLLSFKNRLGFTPVPSHLVDPSSGSDQADRVIGLTALTDPTIMLGYAPGPDGVPVRGERLRLAMTTGGIGPDPRPYLGDYLTGARLHHIAPGHGARPAVDLTGMSDPGIVDIV